MLDSHKDLMAEEAEFSFILLIPIAVCIFAIVLLLDFKRRHQTGCCPFFLRGTLEQKGGLIRIATSRP